MEIKKTELHPEGDKETILYPKTSIDQVDDLTEELEYIREHIEVSPQTVNSVLNFDDENFEVNLTQKIDVKLKENIINEIISSVKKPVSDGTKYRLPFMPNDHTADATWKEIVDGSEENDSGALGVVPDAYGHSGKILMAGEDGKYGWYTIIEKSFYVHSINITGVLPNTTSNFSARIQFVSDNDNPITSLSALPSYIKGGCTCAVMCPEGYGTGYFDYERSSAATYHYRFILCTSSNTIIGFNKSTIGSLTVTDTVIEI